MARMGLGAALAAMVVAAASALGASARATVTSSSGAAGGSVVAAAPAQCSKTTAIQVADRLRFGQDVAGGRATPVDQVLCGSFFGSGSRGMVVSVALPTGCGGSIEWGVFRFAAGGWQLVLKRKNGAFLSAVGSDIRERQGAPKPGDPPCSPSAWKSRIWHWNGARFTASVWKVTPASRGTRSGTPKAGNFKTPSGNIQCDYGYRGAADADAYVRCGIRSGLKPPPRSRGPGCDIPNRVAIRQTGRASLAGPSACPGEDEGDAGPFAGGQPGGPPVWVLGYGKTWSGGGLRCTSTVTGLTCRNKSGHGFFLSRERWRLF